MEGPFGHRGFLNFMCIGAEPCIDGEDPMLRRKPGAAAGARTVGRRGAPTGAGSARDGRTEGNRRAHRADGRSTGAHNGRAADTAAPTLASRRLLRPQLARRPRPHSTATPTPRGAYDHKSCGDSAPLRGGRKHCMRRAQCRARGGCGGARRVRLLSRRRRRQPFPVPPRPEASTHNKAFQVTSQPLFTHAVTRRMRRPLRRCLRRRSGTLRYAAPRSAVQTRD